MSEYTYMIPDVGRLYQITLKVNTADRTLILTVIALGLDVLDATKKALEHAGGEFPGVDCTVMTTQPFFVVA